MFSQKLLVLALLNPITLKKKNPWPVFTLFLKWFELSVSPKPHLKISSQRHLTSDLTMSTEEHKIVRTWGGHFHSGITYTYSNSMNPVRQAAGLTLENVIFPNRRLFIFHQAGSLRNERNTCLKTLVLSRAFFPVFICTTFPLV